MAKPIVAIVGRPNVGKSTIFNKLTGQRLAIVEDTPGVTRDRIFCDCEWSGHKFLLVDTGGIEPRIDDGLLAHMREQAQLAIDSADCIVMVTELSAGVTPQDQDVAGMLMRSGKPVVLAVNKCDKVGEPPMELYDFYSLGLGELIPVSGVHGHGTGDLLDAVCAHLNFEEDEEDTDDRITVAVIGRPNRNHGLFNRAEIVESEKCFVVIELIKELCTGNDEADFGIVSRKNCIVNACLEAHTLNTACTDGNGIEQCGRVNLFPNSIQCFVGNGAVCFVVYGNGLAAIGARPAGKAVTACDVGRCDKLQIDRVVLIVCAFPKRLGELFRHGSGDRRIGGVCKGNGYLLILCFKAGRNVPIVDVVEIHHIVAVVAVKEETENIVGRIGTENEVCPNRLARNGALMIAARVVCAGVDDKARTVGTVKTVIKGNVFFFCRAASVLESEASVNVRTGDLQYLAAGGLIENDRCGKVGRAELIEL